MSDKPPSASYPQYGEAIFDADFDAPGEIYWPKALEAIQKAYKNIRTSLSEDEKWREVERILATERFAQRCAELAGVSEVPVDQFPDEPEPFHDELLDQEREVD